MPILISVACGCDLPSSTGRDSRLETLPVQCPPVCCIRQPNNSAATQSAARALHCILDPIPVFHCFSCSLLIPHALLCIVLPVYRFVVCRGGCSWTLWRLLVNRTSHTRRLNRLIVTLGCAPAPFSTSVSCLTLH